MKKIIFVLLFLVLSPVTVLAWDDCPYNEIDCPIPGECNRYVDTDNDKICDHSQLAPEDRNTEITNTQETNNENLIINNKQNKMTYHLIPIFLVLILLYSVTHILSKKKIISIVNHRKIWNILLLITFLLSGISGILLVIKINFGIVVPLPNILFLHVETGIAMFVISIFHTFWHWSYFKNMFIIKK
ncbi:MAG: hypothetical protein KAI71_04980 [Candidatus Pacebacteria bacterium]|nr:hypothetical protein [Candidatus Paceibacterota bacterium]